MVRGGRSSLSRYLARSLSLARAQSRSLILAHSLALSLALSSARSLAIAKTQTDLAPSKLPQHHSQHPLFKGQHRQGRPCPRVVPLRKRQDLGPPLYSLEEHFMHRRLVQGSGFRVQGSGFRVQGSGFRVQGAGCRVHDSGFRGSPGRTLPRHSAESSRGAALGGGVLRGAGC